MKIIDMHCDTIMALMDTDNNLRKSSNMIDLEKLKKGDYLLQCFAMFVPYKSKDDPNHNPFHYCNRMIDRYYQEIEKNSDLIKPVFTYQDIMNNINNNIMSSMLTIEEGGVCLGNLEFLRNFYRLGVRMITLTWNFENELGYPNSDVINTDKPRPNVTEGLKEKGIEFVKEMNRLGIIIDCSHLSDKGFYDVINNTTKPIVCSHSSARAVCNHPRNMTDDMLLKLKENGGVVGINYAHNFVISEDRIETLDDIVKHFVHVKEVIGVDYIGFGSDFDGISNEMLELKDASMMGLLLDKLKQNGFTDSDLEKICYKNVLRVMKANFGE